MTTADVTTIADAVAIADITVGAVILDIVDMANDSYVRHNDQHE